MRWWLALVALAGCEGFHHEDAPPGLLPVSLTLASQKSCARMADDSLRCWGNRPSRLVASDNADQAPYDVQPRRVPGITGAIAMATSLVNDCSLNSDRTVTCWSEEQEPVSWNAGTGSLDIADSPTGLCFIGQDHTARCGSFLSPLQPMAGGTEVADVAASWSSMCARRTDGSVACGGSNDQGQLGDGTTTDSTDFVSARLPEGALEVGVGVGFACTLGKSGSLYCWGANDRGQLGDGTNVGHPLPALVTAPGLASHLVVGRAHACVETVDGEVYCWGANERGQLGDGTTTDTPNPAQVAGLGAVSGLAAAWLGDHSCAITRSGDVRCWGANDRGELGDGTTSDGLQPVRTSF
jgi:hypothetical protein